MPSVLAGGALCPIRVTRLDGGVWPTRSDRIRLPDGEQPMQVTVKGKNTTVPEKVRARAEHKLAKLQRFDDRILSMDVEFSEERNPRVADPHRVEVTVTTKSGLVRAHANATDPAAAVDQVVDRLQRQVKKRKTRRVDHPARRGCQVHPAAGPRGARGGPGAAPDHRAGGGRAGGRRGDRPGRGRVPSP